MIRIRAFDPAASRYVDRWQAADDSGITLTQTLRCYTPADFELLLRDTGLDLVRIEEPWGPEIILDRTYSVDDRLRNLSGFFAVLRRSKWRNAPVATGGRARGRRCKPALASSSAGPCRAS